ncbi:MAG: dienelactone hydrolase family protein [Kiritimatiellae bacterium]|nr:dienelactone hydrolase family protein [Kiritimatiellia bacterium]MDW8457981.1 dienelactone hydrolase family protein [Verrucomicrobiota bacterium]
MDRWFPFFAIFMTAFASLAAQLEEREVEYSDGSSTLRGFLAYDASREGLRPGVLVVHEWWGLNEYARSRARELAKEGYVALAVDMYGDGKTAAHPNEAGAFASEVLKNKRTAVSRFRAARAFLEQQTVTDPARIAAIGYCFGGAVVLHMARIGEDLKAAASFHGSLATDTPARAGEVRARVLVYHGGADPLIPQRDLEAFEREMRQAGADYRLTVYPGAKHSFTVPDADAKAAEFGLPIAYDPAADAASWADLLAHLREVFGIGTSAAENPAPSENPAPGG